MDLQYWYRSISGPTAKGALELEIDPHPEAEDAARAGHRFPAHHERPRQGELDLPVLGARGVQGQPCDHGRHAQDLGHSAHRRLLSFSVYPTIRVSEPREPELSTFCQISVNLSMSAAPEKLKTIIRQPVEPA